MKQQYRITQEKKMNNEADKTRNAKGRLEVMRTMTTSRYNSSIVSA